MKLYAYKNGSASAKALAEALGIKRIKHEGKPLQVRGGIINWGASRLKRDIVHDGILNCPTRVRVAGNKLETFKALDGRVSIPKWTEERLEAVEWLAEGATVVSRLILTGHSGQGILISDGKEDEGIPDAPLYTQYIRKENEYRAHVFRGNIIFSQRKARKMDVPNEDVNWKVRNLAGGFIFANKDVVLPEVAKQQAIIAVESLGLDFGAVDLVHGKDNRWYVLEVNTAPGLEGTTLEKYVEAFRNL